MFLTIYLAIVAGHITGVAVIAILRKLLPASFGSIDQKLAAEIRKATESHLSN